MKGLVWYRILSVIVALFCSFLAALLLGSIMVILSNPSVGIVVFVLLGVVLYAWHARKFFFIVYVQKEIFTKRQKDWLQVNAIVALLFSLYCIISAIFFISHPAELSKIANQLPEDFYEQAKVSAAYLVQVMTSIFKIWLFASSALLAHILWTYLLLRKHMQLQPHKEEE
jgi:hypothetical protein